MEKGRNREKEGEREAVKEMEWRSDEIRRRLHLIQGLRLLLPYHENNPSNGVIMYVLFQGHFNTQSRVMNKTATIHGTERCLRLRTLVTCT